MSKRLKTNLKTGPDCWHLYNFHMLEVFCLFLFCFGGGGGGRVGGSGLSL